MIPLASDLLPFPGQMRREGHLKSASLPVRLSSSGRIMILGTTLRSCREVIAVAVDKIAWRCRQATESAGVSWGIRLSRMSLAQSEIACDSHHISRFSFVSKRLWPGGWSYQLPRLPYCPARLCERCPFSDRSQAVTRVTVKSCRVSSLVFGRSSAVVPSSRADTAIRRPGGASLTLA